MEAIESDKEGEDARISQEVQLKQGHRAKHGLAEKPSAFDKVPEEEEEFMGKTDRIIDHEECNH